MHEVNITKDLVDLLKKQLLDIKDINSVARVNIRLGKSLGISEESLKFWFKVFSENTGLNNAELNVVFVEGNNLQVDSLEVD